MATPLVLRPADPAVYATRRHLSLIQMDQRRPGAALVDLVVPHYDVAGPRCGRPRVNLELMLRLSCLPPWSDLSDPATEEEVTDSRRRSRTSPRACCGHGGVSRQRHCRTMAASGAHRQNAIRWQDRSPRSPVEAWGCADQSQRTVMGSRWAWSCQRTWPSPGAWATGHYPPHVYTLPVFTLAKPTRPCRSHSWMSRSPDGSARMPRRGPRHPGDRLGVPGRTICRTTTTGRTLSIP